MKNRGFAIIPILVVLAIAVVGGALGTKLVLRSQPQEPAEELQLGIGSNIQYTGTLLPIATSTLQWSIGTTSESGDRRYRHAQIDYATSSAVDIYDSLRVGRSASTTIDEAGNITVQDLTIQGVCSGCGAGIDLQDVYDSSADDAQTTLADAKDVIWFLSDTATDPNVIVSIEADGAGQFQVASASTTVLTIDENGVLGIGTATPGAELSVAGDGLFSGSLAAGDIQATSTLKAAATTTLSARVNIGTTTQSEASSAYIDVQNQSDHAMILRAHPLQDVHIFMILDGIDGIELFTVSANGEVEIIHTATEANEEALHLVVDAAGFGDVIAQRIDYDAGTLAAGEDTAMLLLNLNRFDTTGGGVNMAECLATTGSADAECLHVGVGLDALHQTVGTLGDMDECTDNGVDILASCTDTGTNATIFDEDDDELVIGDAAQFGEIEFVLLTTASGAGIKPTFEYSTGADTWTVFDAIDATNGMRTTGAITIPVEDIGSLWLTGTSTRFFIRITRTQNTIQTAPVERIIQISAVTDYRWDKDAKLFVSTIFTDSTITATGDLRTVADLDVYGADINLGTGAATTTITSAGKLLGIATVTPGALLSVAGAVLSEGFNHADYFKSTSTHTNTFGGVLDITQAATSTWIGGLSVGTGGLLTTTGLTVTGGHILSSGRLEVTDTATSTFAGVISVDDANSTSTFSGTILVDSSIGTSTFTNSVDIIGFTDTTKAVRQSACQDTTQAATTDIDWSLGNCFDIGPLTQDVIFRHTQIEDAKYQTIKIIGTSPNSDFQLDFADSSTTPIWHLMNFEASTTPAEIQEGAFEIFFNVASSTEFGTIQVASGGEPL